MTGALRGANPEQLDELAARFDREADQLETIRDAIGGSLRETGWLGPDGDQFRHDWEHHYMRVITTAATALREAARTVRVNAEQQRQASGADGAVVDVSAMVRTMLGPVSYWTAGEGSDRIDYANLAASVGVGALGFARKYYSWIGVGYSTALTIAAITEGAQDGWRDENIGQVTLGVVGIGIGVAGALATGGLGVALFGTGVVISAASTHFPVVNAAVGGAVREVGEAAQAIWHGTTSFIDNAVDGFTGALGEAGAVVSGVGRAVGGVADAAGNALSGVVDGGKKVLSKLNPFD